jgi:predicted GNAT superfamily acetyltransferase
LAFLWNSRILDDLIAHMADIAPKPTISIREMQSYDDLRQVENVEKEIWGLSEADVLPTTLTIASKAAGSLWLGAFEDQQLVGFAFGLLGLENGAINIHSHMLGVLPAYRDLDLGYKLKLIQREQALAMRISDGRGGELRIREMTWTFDPLQARNAHLNFAKLGVLSNRYIPDFYGPATSSVLHQNGTDRLWVRWLLDSRRVRLRTKGKFDPSRHRAEVIDALSVLTPLVRFIGNSKPVRSDLAAALARQRIAIEIPSDILRIEQTDAKLAREWRAATQWAFGEALDAGFFVAEFCRTIRGQQGPGVYLLGKGSVEDFADGNAE